MKVTDETYRTYKDQINAAAWRYSARSDSQNFHDRMELYEELKLQGAYLFCKAALSFDESRPEPFRALLSKVLMSLKAYGHARYWSLSEVLSHLTKDEDEEADPTDATALKLYQSSLSQTDDFTDLKDRVSALHEDTKSLISDILDRNIPGHRRIMRCTVLEYYKVRHGWSEKRADFAYDELTNLLKKDE